jgi:hypothetical protein
MPSDEFRAMATDEILELVEKWEDREKRSDMRFGVIATIAANLMRGENQQPYHPADFFRSLEDTRPGLPTQDELVEKIMSAFGVSHAPDET